MTVANYRYQDPSFCQQEETVLLHQLLKHPVLAESLRARYSRLNTVTVKKNAQLTKCTVESLLVSGDLSVHSCNLTKIRVGGKASLYNCYQMDSIIANGDITLINKIEGAFVNLVETQKSASIKNMRVGEFIFRSGHTMIDNCHISCIRIKKPEQTEKECILELIGDYQVETIISEGVDVEIRGRELEP